MMLLKLRLEPGEKRESVGGAAGETSQNFIAEQAADFFAECLTTLSPIVTCRRRP